MPSFKIWLQAARPRTLPLSISGILVGGAMACGVGTFDPLVFILAILATLGFQVLSNYANDYGDGVKGTDMAGRVGPARAMQSGLLTASDLKRAIVITSSITIVIVIVLIYRAFGPDNLGISLLFFFLGLAAILSAIKYTVGKSAYGYRGLGDLFVFIFFGVVGVLGSYFMLSKQLELINVLPAITIGALSTMVLHLNNMRDREADQLVGKNTLAVILGKRGAVRYHVALLCIALSCWVLYLIISDYSILIYLCCIAFIPLLINIKTVLGQKSHPLLDPELKKVALSTFLLSVLFFGISYYLSH